MHADIQRQLTSRTLLRPWEAQRRLLWCMTITSSIAISAYVVIARLRPAFSTLNNPKVVIAVQSTHAV
ncbi:hypothetical protein BDR03DRAFT_970038 [Suillus americanus]|nr:hypothetical protein BDR03DRAFT_970038 [Suillus americanus]